MKNAIILHGAGASPSSFWLPGLSKSLESLGYSVWVPLLPNADKPDLSEQLPFVLSSGRFSEETIIVGHSAACPLILSILENIETRVNKIILVAGFYEESASTPTLILQKEYGWDKIKDNAKEIIIINSDDDPWGCDVKQGLFLFGKIGGTFIARHGEGHMGSNKFNQPYKDFPLLVKLIELN